MPANTYIATVLAITKNGAKPVFVKPDVYYGIDADMIEAAITKKTKAIMPVHLYGQACDMYKIMNIADKYNIVYQDVMWQGDLANRKETTAYFWIIEKTG